MIILSWTSATSTRVFCLFLFCFVLFFISESQYFMSYVFVSTPAAVRDSLFVFTSR